MIIGNTVKINYLNTTFTYPDEIQNTDTSIHDFIAVIKSVNRLPFDKSNIFFSNDIWDFSTFTNLSISSSALKFNFKLCCDTYREQLKAYVLIQILDLPKKVQSVHQEFFILHPFFNYLESQGTFDIEDITDDKIQDFLSRYDNILRFCQIQACLKNFFDYYSINYGIPLSDRRRKILSEHDKGALSAYKKNSKISNIPSDYYNQLLKAVINISDSPDQDKYTRAAACLMIILMQTGLRIGECLALKTDALQETTIFSGRKTYYLKYRTWKRERGNGTYSWERTYVNDLTQKAYKQLIDLYHDERLAAQTDFLYLGSRYNIAYKTKYPLYSSLFTFNSLRVYAEVNKVFPIIDIPPNAYPGLTPHIIPKWSAVSIAYPDAKTITIPTSHQFRVYVCTDLYNKGVPLQYIRKFMGHLSNEMQGYYVRPNMKKPQEDMKFSSDVIKNIAVGETKLLGGSDPSGLTKQINKFIADNHFNVQKDMDAICAALVKKIPIRQKTGGVCIKSSMRECHLDNATNEFYCAYGVCPNLYHFYYMADLSYRQCKELLETISINQKNEFFRQVEKETNMLKTIAKTKLLPELDELKNVIEKKGAEAVMMQYPDLTEIIENFEEIEKEAKRWTKL